MLPKIPCMPVSPADAIHLLQALNTHGPQAADLSERWHGGALGIYGVGYNIGPSPLDTSIRLVNNVAVRHGPIHNVIATIPGATTAADEVVILGNHRDAWGPGAGDPNSGSAALNEVARALGIALRAGWRPRRTIVIASWEGEEFGQVGSLPWIRQHLDWLRASTVAYLNVIVAAVGTEFRAKGSPLLHGALHAAAGLVPSPNQTFANQSVHDLWRGTIDTPGGGDAMRFQGVPCVSTVDFGFASALGPEHAAYPYHTGLATLEWMERYGDPEWQYHVATARLWALLAADLADSEVLPMSVGDYGVAIRGWVDEIDHVWREDIDLSVLYDSVERLIRAGRLFDAHADSLRTTATSHSQPGSWWSPGGHWLRMWAGGGPGQREAAIRHVNRVYIALERKFFLQGGLDDDPLWHHVIFAPSSWHHNAPPMPGLYSSLQAGNWTNAEVRQCPSGSSLRS